MKRTFIRRAPIACLLACAAVWASSAVAEPERVSVFERLDRAEVRMHEHRERAARLNDRIDRTDKELDRLDLRRQTVKRASQPVRRRLATIVSHWERSLRQTERAQGWGPGRSGDTRRLLEYASVRALPEQMKDIDVLHSLQEDKEAYDDLLGHRLRLTVSLAQHKASETTAQAEREAELEKAKTDPNVREDLEKTADELHTSMSRFLTNPSTADFHRQKGTLVRPVPGPPKYTFGPRPTVTAAATVRHTGHTWTVEKGTDVRATAAGLVVYAHSFQGYGNLVMIDHGAGYHSLYAHLDSIDVKQGDKVRRGATLGKSGDTGSLDGPKLYFELRQDGRAIDPAPWFLRLK